MAEVIGNARTRHPGREDMITNLHLELEVRRDEQWKLVESYPQLSVRATSGWNGVDDCVDQIVLRSQLTRLSDALHQQLSIVKRDLQTMSNTIDSLTARVTQLEAKDGNN